MRRREAVWADRIIRGNLIFFSFSDKVRLAPARAIYVRWCSWAPKLHENGHRCTTRNNYMFYMLHLQLLPLGFFRRENYNSAQRRKVHRRTERIFAEKRNCRRHEITTHGSIRILKKIIKKSRGMGKRLQHIYRCSYFVSYTGVLRGV